MLSVFVKNVYNIYYHSKRGVLGDHNHLVFSFNLPVGGDHSLCQRQFGFAGVILVLSEMTSTLQVIVFKDSSKLEVLKGMRADSLLHCSK